MIMGYKKLNIICFMFITLYLISMFVSLYYSFDKTTTKVLSSAVPMQLNNNINTKHDTQDHEDTSREDIIPVMMHASAKTVKKTGVQAQNNRETLSIQNEIKAQTESKVVSLTHDNEGTTHKYYVGNSVVDSLGVLSSRNATNWTRRVCNQSAPFRLAKLPSKFGTLSMYIYDSMIDDLSTTSMILKGQIPEKKEIEQFLNISHDLPVIDVGSNLGTVALQAAMLRRHVVAMEPVYLNAQRLCRSALDFGLDRYLHVLMNAASSSEGQVTLVADYIREMARYSVQGVVPGKFGYEPVQSYAILLDTLLEVLPFKQVALKIDVEAHEGHVLAGAEQLFQELYVPLVWLEWEHVKRLPHYGAPFIIDFMRTRNMTPHDVISLETLSEKDPINDWPATVLWIHESF